MATMCPFPGNNVQKKRGEGPEQYPWLPSGGKTGQQRGGPPTKDQARLALRSGVSRVPKLKEVESQREGRDIRAPQKEKKRGKVTTKEMTNLLCVRRDSESTRFNRKNEKMKTSAGQIGARVKKSFEKKGHKKTPIEPAMGKAVYGTVIKKHTSPVRTVPLLDPVESRRERGRKN